MMEVRKAYVVFKMNEVMGNEKHLSLEKVQFKGLVSNCFDSQKDAIRALIDDERTYQDYLILPSVYITNY